MTTTGDEPPSTAETGEQSTTPEPTSPTRPDKRAGVSARLPLDWVERWDWPDFGPVADWLRPGRGAGMRLEEFTEGDEHVVRAELPGVDPDKDVEITISHGALHLRAERRESSRSQTSTGFRSEFRYGSLARSIPLPAGVDETQVSARYHDGVLEIRMPTTGSPISRPVRIEHG